MITQPGIYAMSAAEYHADPCPEPSLSNSVARILLDQSPKHARFAHPRLNPDREEYEVTETMRKGTALHAIMLGIGDAVIEVPFADYRKSATANARDEAIDNGKTPLLSKNFDAVNACAASALAELRQREDCAEFFAPGQSEAVAIWRQGGIWCRGMIDRLPEDPAAPIFDLKGTEMSANPAEWDRRMVRAYRTQDRFYAGGTPVKVPQARKPGVVQNVCWRPNKKMRKELA